MRSWSIPFGRIFGVEIRLHTFFVLVLGLAISYSITSGVSAGRGMVLWLLLVFAVAVREIARAIAAAYHGLEVRQITLLPIGGQITYASAESVERAAMPGVQKAMAMVGPVANLVCGAVLAMLIYAATPEIQVGMRPWITPTHLLRAMVWIQIFLGAINLLPVWPLDGGRVLRGEFMRARGAVKGTRSSAGIGQMIALGTIVVGALTTNLWLMLLGLAMILFAHMEDQGMMMQGAVDTVTMRDVMLTNFCTISASDTLEDALHKSIHTLQNVFPVVRGANVVGAVSRQKIVEALNADGNGYVQGVMSKSFETAEPGDSLVKTLGRIATGAGAQLVPVLEGERIVGIVTPQNVANSMGLLAESRRLKRVAAGDPGE